jgi:hypothetical protein
VGQTGGTLHFKIKHSILGRLDNFIFILFLSDGPNQKKEKKLNLGGTSCN